MLQRYTQVCWSLTLKRIWKAETFEFDSGKRLRIVHTFAIPHFCRNDFEFEIVMGKLMIHHWLWMALGGPPFSRTCWSCEAFSDTAARPQQGHCVALRTTHPSGFLAPHKGRLYGESADGQEKCLCVSTIILRLLADLRCTGGIEHC